MTNKRTMALGAVFSTALAVSSLSLVARSLFDSVVDTQSRKVQHRRHPLAPSATNSNTQNTRNSRNQPSHQTHHDWFRAARREVAIRSEDGLMLRGWMFDADSALGSHNYVICCHGFGSSPEGMASHAYHHAQSGFHVLLPALRAHQSSEGRYVGLGWLDKRDLIRWIDMIIATDSCARIILHGISLGAAGVMMCVGEDDLPENVVGAIEDSGFCSAAEQFTHLAKENYHIPSLLIPPVLSRINSLAKRYAGYDITQISSLDSLRRARIPMLFIHGGKDLLVPASCADRCYEACSSPDKQKLIIPDAEHGMAALAAPGAYWFTVDRFMRRVIEQYS